MKTTQVSELRRVWTTVLLSTSLLLGGLALSLSSQAADCPELLRHTFNNLKTGQPQELCQYKGKLVLVVNTASYCGRRP